mgnify:CR=1 FL=1
MVEDYYTNPAISQSQLKLLLGSDPSIFNTVEEPDLYFEEKKHLYKSITHSKKCRKRN